MPYARTCPACGDDFTAARVNRRWCSDRCRMAGKRAAAAGRPFGSAKPASATHPQGQGPVAATVAAALAAMKAEGDALAPLALNIADRLDRDTEGPAAGLAALSRELRATMADIATAHPLPTVDELTKLRARRAARRAK